MKEDSKTESIKWNDQGLSQIHAHERKAIETIEEITTCQAGEVYMDETSTIWLHTNDGAHLIVGDIVKTPPKK